MGDVLNEAYGIVQCRECPWYKSCAVPLRFSPEDIRRQMESMPGANPGQSFDGMPGFLGSMVTAAQNSILEGCPVFIERLRSSPQLAQKLKQLMQNWGSAESPQH
ncbi:MAG: hypothetical protein V2A77_07660 [Pseudomonadota bacterium]